jgi:hypothetical protein
MPAVSANHEHFRFPRIHRRPVQLLTIAVSNSYFINPTGPAVVWSPAVPGRISNCVARGNAEAAQAYFSSCNVSTTTAESEALHVLPNTFPLDGMGGEPGHVQLAEPQDDLLSGVVALSINSGETKLIAQGANEGSQADMMHLHLHMPPETFAISFALREVSLNYSKSTIHYASLTWFSCLILIADCECVSCMGDSRMACGSHTSS